MDFVISDTENIFTGCMSYIVCSEYFSPRVIANYYVGQLPRSWRTCSCLGFRLHVFAKPNIVGLEKSHFQPQMAKFISFEWQVSCRHILPSRKNRIKKGNNFLSFLRMIRILWPAPHSRALILSPILPFSQFLPNFPSSFMWPITGSTALRRFSSFRIVGVIPRRWPEMKTAVFFIPWPRYPRST